MKTLPLCLLALTTVLSLPAPATSQEKPEILILGTFHMANPGQDVHNLEADDMLSPRRQHEIRSLLDILATFRPTVVAVEASATSARTAEGYRRYLAGEDTLTRNETHQIGFRLAREAGLETVHGVDVDGDFPYYRVQNYAIANGMEERFDSLRAATGARVERTDRMLRTHSVVETLQHMNADSTVAEDVGGYYGFVAFGEPYEYAGPDLVAEWFRRNVRIYRNIRALVSSPDDRVLVVYGAGHLGWLRRMVEDDPGVWLRTLGDLTAGGR